ncbi:unnamed protein product [Bemisia tabaci]|uniref:Uncharacterized protein n=1 Tax=Bemisia tabaci TaxID=7038 RepID=A0A9P0AHR3_BEMTA|nr:unnamed protein product [Bemisia tabaci]
MYVSPFNQDVSEKIEALNEILVSLKSKINWSNHQEKLQLLTIAPSSWTTAKIAEELGVSVHAVKTARQLKYTAGILAVLPPKCPADSGGRRTRAASLRLRSQIVRL